MSNEYPPLVHCLQKRPPQRLGRQPVLKGGSRVRERVAPPLLVCKNILLNYNSRNCVLELVSVQLSGYKFLLALSPLITTIDCVVEMETKKRPINNPLVFSSIVSFIFYCLLRGIDSRRDRASRSSKNASSLDSTKRRKYPLTRHCER